MIRYFISYNYRCANGFGFGNAEARRNKEIEGIDDIAEISRRLEKDMNYIENSLVIINFIKLN